MKVLNPTLIIEKNKQYTANPWIVLLILEVDDTTTAYFALYPENVTFAGQEYIALPAAIEAIEETAEGSIGGLNIAVANVNRAISAYVENNQLLGNTVTVRIVNMVDLTDSAAKIDFKYTVNRITLSAKSALFELGHENLMQQQLPRQRFIRTKCRYRYRDSNCKYLSDWGTDLTEQAFLIGGNGVKLHGWNLLNSTGCSNGNIGITAPRTLMLRNEQTAGADWYNAVRTGTFLYKKLVGDFTLQTWQRYVSTDFLQNEVGCQFQLVSSANLNHWVAFRWERTVANGTRMLRVNTVGGVSTAVVLSWARGARFVRAGANITLYTTNDRLNPQTWTAQTTYTRTEFPTELYIGFAATNAAPTSGMNMYFGQYTPDHAYYRPFFEVISGGLASCDYSLDGTNGCRVHENAINYGGFPAIPYGRLTGL